MEANSPQLLAQNVHMSKTHLLSHEAARTSPSHTRNKCNHNIHMHAPPPSLPQNAFAHVYIHTHSLMKRFSEGLCLLRPCVKPHKARATLAAATNLDEHQVTGLPRSSQLVPLPGDGCVVGVRWAHYLQGANSLVRNTTFEYQDVEANDVQSCTHFLSKDKYWPY